MARKHICNGAWEIFSYGSHMLFIERDPSICVLFEKHGVHVYGNGGVINGVGMSDVAALVDLVARSTECQETQQNT